MSGSLRWIAGIPLAAWFLLASACRTPTEVTIIVRNKIPCAGLHGVQITVGPDPRATEEKVQRSFVTTATRQCDGELIGSLVVTPGANQAAVVVAGALVEGAACLPPAYSGCVVARRSFGFVDHTALEIPIELEVDCENVACDAVSTCNKGACVPSAVTCQATGICTTLPDPSVAPPVEEDAGQDATVRDSAPSPDAGADGPGMLDAGGGDGSASGDSGPTSTCEAGHVQVAGCPGGAMCDPGQYCCSLGGDAGTTCVSDGLPCSGLARCCDARVCPTSFTCCIADSTALTTTAKCTATCATPGQPVCNPNLQPACSDCSRTMWGSILSCQ